jgi:hypothetical protein
MKRREFLQLVTAATAGTFLPACTAATPGTNAPVATTKPKLKRGLGYGTKGPQWADKLKRVGARWFYTWNFLPPENVPAGLEFVPMMWGRSREDAFPKHRADLEKNKLKTLLGYNEPDQKDQSNITVEQALDQWPKLMELGVRLGSPGCVHPDREWMKAFMKGVDERKLRVDFVTVHSYGGPSADALMKRLAALHELFGRPIWITEFAVGDWNAKTPAENKHKPERVVEFVRSVLPQLDACKFVERYAWFPAKPTSAPLGTSALFNEDGSLTAVGEAYRSS